MTADVTVQRIPVLLDAAVRAFDDSQMVDIGEVDSDDEAPDSREQIGRDPATALSWLLDPTEGCGRCWKPVRRLCSARRSTQMGPVSATPDGDDPAS